MMSDIPVGGDNYAVITSRVTGGLSALSSLLIIVIILRSPTKLTTIYHRIIFGMSCVDILASIAIGLTTLPMPQDLDYVIGTDTDSWVGSRLGNAQTCSAQGFVFVFGLISMVSYNGSLWIYYTCAIAFRLKEKSIVKYIEPVLHIIPLSMGLGWAIPPIIYGLYNPTPWDPGCNIALEEKPGFNSAEDAKIGNTTNMDILNMATIVFLLVLVFLCFAFILWKVVQTERRLHGPRQIVRQTRTLEIDRVERSHRNTKLLLYQALAYFLSYMVTLSPLFVRSLIIEPLWVIRLSFVLVPLQGFFNLLIFISHKVISYRRAHTDVSRCSVLVLLVKGSVEDPLLFSRISLLKIDEHRRKMEIELADERIVESLGEFDLDVPPSSNGALSHVDVSFDSRENLSGFSKSQGDVESDKEMTDSSRCGLSGFSSDLLPELESQFVEDPSVIPSVREDEALSYSRGGSVFSSLKGIVLHR